MPEVLELGGLVDRAVSRHEEESEWELARIRGERQGRSRVL